MRNKIGNVCMITGAVLIMSALLLFLYNRHENNSAGQHAISMLESVQASVLGDAEHNTLNVNTTNSSEEMTVAFIDGYSYIGYLSVPTLSLELPVLSEWDYRSLKRAPCRQFGSIKTDSLVIAGHNYTKHFGRLSKLRVGDFVMFTDMDGGTHTYTVCNATVLQPTDVEEVQSSSYDLVLYTCTYGGSERIVVYCNRM